MMNRRILKLAIPNVISNITIPMLGLVSIAIAGNLGNDEAIGAIGIGASIFGFIYWNFGFIRMGASGMTAQALGARNFTECANVFIRSVAVALTVAVLLLIFQRPIGRFAMGFMEGTDNVMSMVGEYFFARIWAVPATISLFAIQGWFIGMQNSKTPMYVSIAINLISITLGYIFAIKMGMGVAGIAWGTVLAQYTGATISLIFMYIHYNRMIKYINWKECLNMKQILRFFDVNKDIFIRTACIVCVYTFFTAESSRYGTVILATNTILIQIFTFFSYMSDGFAYAAEALTGRFVGAKNFKTLKLAIKNMFWWSFGIAATFSITYKLFWQQIMGLFKGSESVVACAGDYIMWVMIVPLVGFAPFLMDGIMIGATKTKVLRNSTLIATTIFFGLYYLLKPTYGNDALWFSFVIFIGCRGVFQFFMTDRLRSLTR